jgi:hypothetical protein
VGVVATIMSDRVTLYPTSNRNAYSRASRVLSEWITADRRPRHCERELHPTHETSADELVLPDRIRLVDLSLTKGGSRLP